MSLYRSRKASASYGHIKKPGPSGLYLWYRNHLVPKLQNCFGRWQSTHKQATVCQHILQGDDRLSDRDQPLVRIHQGTWWLCLKKVINSRILGEREPLRLWMYCSRGEATNQAI